MVPVINSNSHIPPYSASISSKFTTPKENNINILSNVNSVTTHSNILAAFSN